VAQQLSIVTPSRPLVLIVDDHADTAEMIAEYLATHGARAVRASSVAQARQVLAGLRVDAVVTDFSMPGASGLDLLEELRSMPGGDAIPVVMMSAHDRAGSVAAAAAELGAWFVAKPFELAELGRAVRNALLSGGRRISKPPPALSASEHSRRGLTPRAEDGAWSETRALPDGRAGRTRARRAARG
jgi:CheY-like chemotaxis protein